MAVLFKNEGISEHYFLFVQKFYLCMIILQNMKKIVSTNNAPAVIGPYSQANLVNGVLYISGQIPIDPSTGNLLDGIEIETHQVMKKI